MAISPASRSAYPMLMAENMDAFREILHETMRGRNCSTRELSERALLALHREEQARRRQNDNDEHEYELAPRIRAGRV